jgi:murein DD-endopeptidase MepM/ murein hydrolase activator NlpD
MARPFKPPPLSDQIIDTINPLNWFSGFVWKNLEGDWDYHLAARAHSKVTGLPPISPTDLAESPSFGPASISIAPDKWFKYGFVNGLWGQTKNVLKINIALNEFDAHSDWIDGWKPKLIQNEDGSNSDANKMGLVRKKSGVTGEILEGWTEPLRPAANDKERQTNANEKEARLKLYNQLEWWTKTEDIKPYRDLAWKPIMETAIEAAYFTAERQKNEGTITQAEFDHFKNEFYRVVNNKEETSLRKKLSTANKEAEEKGLKFKTTEASPTDVKDMLNPKSEKRVNYFREIQEDQDYNTQLHLLFKQVVGDEHGGHGHGIINLERDADGKRLLKNLRTLDHGESHYAWKDFLQKFDKGETIRSGLWDAVFSSTDFIRIAEPIYAVLTRGGTMSPETYKFLGRLNQVGNKTFPFNAGLLLASTLNKSGYFGLAAPNSLVKFNNFAYLEFKEGRFGWAGFGAKFKASQFEGILWNIDAKDDKDHSLYALINKDARYNAMSVNEATYFTGLREDQFAEIGRRLLTPDELYTYIEGLLDPTWNATEKAAFLAKLRDKIDKYKGSESFRTLQDLVDQGKLEKIELFQFLGLADTKGLSAQYQGLVGRLSKFSGQAHNFIQVWSGKMWKLPGLNKLFPIWSKYKKGNLFFNNPFAMKLGAWLGKLLGGAVAGPLGAIIGYLIEDLVHKFIHNIWASLTGGHPHALIGDNTKKMFIIGCAIALAPFALVLFIIIILLGGAFAWLGGGNNESGEIIVNKDVVVNVRNLDTPISTIANNLTTAQDTKFDITIKNNLDKEIDVWGVTISEYTEDNYWKDIKTMVYPKTIFDTFDDKDNFTISANGEYSTQITLPFYNAVRNNEDGRVIKLHINVSYIQTDGGAGNASGSGSLVLGKVDQPIGLPVQVTLIDGTGYPITQCDGDTYSGSPHHGIDIGTNLKIGVPIYSTLSGVITVCNMHNNKLDRTKPGCLHQPYNGDDSAYGNMVLITNGNYTAIYAHLRDIVKDGPSTPPNIVDGVHVNVGDLVAYSDHTGNSSNPHIHYEIRDKNISIDPWQFVSTSLSCVVK